MSYLQSNTTIIKNKVGLLNLAQELGNISKACKVMGFSRDTFYRYYQFLGIIKDGCLIRPILLFTLMRVN